MSYEYEKYVTTVDKIVETIDKYGVAVIPNILDKNEIDEMVNGMWDTLEYLTAKFEVPMNRKNHRTFRSIEKLYPLRSMLIQHWSVGHADFIWKLRQNPKIVNIFSKIWNVPNDELLVSFDGASFQMPPEVTKIGWYKEDWLHTDQSYARNHFECIQSWVTGFDVNENDATLTILEGSNKYHKEFAQKFNVRLPADWYMIKTEEHLDYYINEKKCPKKCIKCPAGSIVFWDSRTIHCGQGASSERRIPNFRCVVYICMLPRYVATAEELEKKRQTFQEMRLTSHWANKAKLFPIFPRHRVYDDRNQVQQLPRPHLTPLGLKLAGF